MSFPTIPSIYSDEDLINLNLHHIKKSSFLQKIFLGSSKDDITQFSLRSPISDQSVKNPLYIKFGIIHSKTSNSSISSILLSLNQIFQNKTSLVERELYVTELSSQISKDPFSYLSDKLSIAICIINFKHKNIYIDQLYHPPNTYKLIILSSSKLPDDNIIYNSVGVYDKKNHLHTIFNIQPITKIKDHKDLFNIIIHTINSIYG